MPPKAVQEIHRCELCGVDCQGDLPYEQHLIGKKHLKKAAKAAEARAVDDSEHQARAVDDSEHHGLKRQRQARGSPHENSKTPKTTAALPLPAPATTLALPIPASNRGHKMLLKMGWCGGGLGASGTGRHNPVMISTVYTGRLGLGGTLVFPLLPPENQSFLHECEVCGEPVPKNIWEEHCAGRKHRRKLAERDVQVADEHDLEQAAPTHPKKKKRAVVVVSEGARRESKTVLVQSAQRFCEACQRAVPIKAWSMHCGGKKHLAKLRQ